MLRPGLKAFLNGNIKLKLYFKTHRMNPLHTFTTTTTIKLEQKRWICIQWQILAHTLHYKQMHNPYNRISI